MNILQILDELEKFLTEILLWIVFIPKTLYKIVANPNWVAPYITEELAKTNDRFKNFMSPIILFLINSLLLFFLFEYVVFHYGGFGFLPEGFRKILDFNHVGDVESKLKDVNTLWMAVGFMLLPIIFAIFVEFLRKGKFTRELVKRSIYIQSYYFSPILFVYFSVIIFYNLLPFDPIVDYSSYLLFVLILLWFSFVQIRFLYRELQLSKIKATLLYLLLLFFLTVGYVAYDGITTLSAKSSNSSLFNNIVLPKSGVYYVSIKHKWFGKRDYDVIINHSDKTKSTDYFMFPELTDDSEVKQIPFNYVEGDTLDITIHNSGDAIHYDFFISFENDYGSLAIDSTGVQMYSSRIIPDSIRYFVMDGNRKLPSFHPSFTLDRFAYADNGSTEKISWQASVFGVIGLIFKILWFVLFLFLFIAIIRGILPHRSKNPDYVKQDD